MQKFSTYVVELKKNIQETHDTNTLIFEKPNNFDFKPGQFVTMQFIDDNENVGKKVRSYTISSSPLDNMIEITVKKEGEFSTMMCNSEIGTKFRVSGPFGHFEFLENAQEKEHVFLSAGSGITPFKCFMRYVTSKRLSNKIRLFYSNKTPADIIFKNEFEKLAKENHNIKNFFTITRPEGTGWEGLTGRIDKEMLINNLYQPIDAIYYISGPKEMIESMIDILGEMNVKPENIKTEKWG
jgi:ferredoxin-NADP reductase